MKKEMKEVILNDEDGNELTLNLFKEFEYKNKTYAILFEDHECDDECDDECDHEEGHNVYIMEVKKDNDKEEYIEVNNDKLIEELIDEAEKLIYEEE